MISKYLISIPHHDISDKGVIHDTETKLKVGVVDLYKTGFEPKKGEVHYFVSDTDNDVLLAFETDGYKKAHKNLLILDMIARYCVYLGFAGAIIHAKFPVIRLN